MVPLGHESRVHQYGIIIQQSCQGQNYSRTSPLTNGIKIHIPETGFGVE